MQIPAVDERPPRFYHLMLQPDLLEGWSLIREWGYQGARGRVKQEHFSHQRGATEAMIKNRDAQLARGYRVVFIEGQKEGE